MTEEERQKTILELERANCKFPSTAEDLGLQHDKETKPGLQQHMNQPKRSGLQQHMNEPKCCEICDMELIDGECEAHPQYMRMHRRAIRQLRGL